MVEKNAIKNDTAKLRTRLKNAMNEVLDGDKILRYNHMYIMDDNLEGYYNVEFSVDYTKNNYNNISQYDFGYDFYLKIYDNNNQLLSAKKVEDVIQHRMLHSQRLDIVYTIIVNQLTKDRKNSLYDLYKNSEIMVLSKDDVQFVEN